MEKLTKMLDYYLGLATSPIFEGHKEWIYHQAFGAVDYHIWVYPEDAQLVYELWLTYRPRFEKAIWGVGE